ncbi:MAG: UDP-N-acetylmuramoyl-L-alanyl-D-glutamate--2,6-diaminopimelate ligase [Candidatus Latescibacterota bacterium]
MPVLLRTLLEDVETTRVRGPLDVPIGKVECDSRSVSPGDLFVAVRGGQERDRHQFVPDAVARGAAAVVVEDEADTGSATCVVVPNCRAVACRMAACACGHPSRRLGMLGVTGTNGKTTTALLLRQVLESAGVPCGYVGTLGRIVAGGLEPLCNTTPEAPELQRHLQAMVEADRRAAALEVSSHGLALERVAGIDFRVAVFTNLSRDHLDFHGTEERYFAAKARLFEGLDPARGARAVINADDPAGGALLARTRAPVLTYGWDEGAQVRVLAMHTRAAGMRLDLQTPAGTARVDSALMGRFNACNVAAAVAGALAFGLELPQACAGIGRLERVAGRFERVVAGQDFLVVVDYAHTPGGLETVLETARELTRGRLICVFGCGGDRDRGKRPLMGRVAAALADLVVLTSDNPRGESPSAIIAEIAAGVPAGAATHTEPDRRRAIAWALGEARGGDLVLLAGKGHETVQIVGDRRLPFDDTEVARQVLQGLPCAAAPAAAGAGGRS